VDAGFSCPNRGKDRRAQGCLYCDERGSRAPYLGTDKVQSSNWQRSLRAQIDDARKFLEHRYAARKYILYFQAFSSTYAPVQRLKEIYDYGLDYSLTESRSTTCISHGVALYSPSIWPES